MFAVDLRYYAMTFFTFSLVEAIDLIVHFREIFLIFTSLRSNTEVYNE